MVSLLTSAKWLPPESAIDFYSNAFPSHLQQEIAIRYQHNDGTI